MVPGGGGSRQTCSKERWEGETGEGVDDQDGEAANASTLVLWAGGVRRLMYWGIEAIDCGWKAAGLISGSLG